MFARHIRDNFIKTGIARSKHFGWNGILFQSQTRRCIIYSCYLLSQSKTCNFSGSGSGSNTHSGGYRALKWPRKCTAKVSSVAANVGKQALGSLDSNQQLAFLQCLIRVTVAWNMQTERTKWQTIRLRAWLLVPVECRKEDDCSRMDLKQLQCWMWIHRNRRPALHLANIDVNINFICL